MFSNIIEQVAFKLIKLAVTELPLDIKQALQQAYKKEESETGKTQLKAILKNLEMAKKDQIPMCQDTGIIIFYIKVGSKFKDLNKIEKALYDATIKATKEIPLRPNAVNPFTRKNTSNNTGRYIPFLNWEVVQGNDLELTVMPKGGGSENVSVLGMLNPGQGVEGIKKFVVDSVIAAGAKPCPPNILGVGVGGGADIALKLAKASLLKPLHQINADPKLAELEKELCNLVNLTGIGPMGLGGKTTVLAVKMEYAHRHPASYPVAVVFQCWAARRASAQILENGEVEYLSHKVI
jgi:fumarate hydratase subunit alpha